MNAHRGHAGRTNRCAYCGAPARWNVCVKHADLPAKDADWARVPSLAELRAMITAAGATR